MELTLKEIGAFYGCCVTTAQMRVKEVKQGLGLPKTKKRILAAHIAKYEGLKVSEVKEIIKIYQKVTENSRM